MKKIISHCLLIACLTITACSNQTTIKTDKNNMQDWKTTLEEKLPLLGHRNWIVITDMAYPLQSNPGITTLMADESYHQVVAKVNEMIGKAPHVFAHIYQDSEQERLSEQLAPGWDKYKEQLQEALNPSDVTLIPHEELIKKLDEAAKLYQVVIIKTDMTIPYTTTFFELDCKYWDADREAAIRK